METPAVPDTLTGTVAEVISHPLHISLFLYRNISELKKKKEKKIFTGMYRFGA